MNKHYISVIFAAIFWGTMGIFVNGLSALGLSTVQIAMLRALVSCGFMAAALLCKDRKLFRIRFRDLWMFFGSGILSYFLFNNCYFTAIKSVGVAVASVLLYTAPVFVTLMSCLFFRETLTKKKVLCLILAVGGCGLVSGLASGGAETVSTEGVLIGLASGFTYALYSIFSTVALRKYSAVTVTFYTFLFGAAAAVAIGDPVNTFRSIANPTGLLWALALGIISGAVPYFLYTFGLSGIHASHAAVLATVEPVVASLIGIFFYREKADLFTVCGIVMIIGASILLNTKIKKKEVDKHEEN